MAVTLSPTALTKCLDYCVLLYELRHMYHEALVPPSMSVSLICRYMCLRKWCTIGDGHMHSFDL